MKTLTFLRNEEPLNKYFHYQQHLEEKYFLHQKNNENKLSGSRTHSDFNIKAVILELAYRYYERSITLQRYQIPLNNFCLSHIINLTWVSVEWSWTNYIFIRVSKTPSNMYVQSLLYLMNSLCQCIFILNIKD